MMETWLRPNRRAIGFGGVPPLVVGLLGAWLVFGFQAESRGSGFWIGVAMMAIAAATLAFLFVQLRRPRVAYRDAEVLFYLRGGQPIGVPVEAVEAFFLGQGPAGLPVSGGQQKSVNLVARLSQRAAEWAQVEVKPALGEWCHGYVTIRGTWCEPLSNEVVRRLNRRLKEVKTLSEKRGVDGMPAAPPAGIRSAP